MFLINKLCVSVVTRWLLEDGQNLPYNWKEIHFTY